jgi:Acetyltransferase (GNAT) domain
MSDINLRHALSSDLDSLIDLETRIMHFPMGHRVREWFRPDHPTVQLTDFAVITVDSRIVSAAVLLRETILYCGIPVPIGIWEAVVTDTDHQRRGYCRQLFEFLSIRSEAEILFVQGATWMYRRFGYFPALGNYGGGNSGGSIVSTKDFPATDLTARPATAGDAEFLVKLRQDACQRYVVSSPITQESVRHDLHPDRRVVNRGEVGLNKWQEFRILESAGTPIGYLMHDPWDIALLMEIEVVPGAIAWREACAAAIHETVKFAGTQEARVVLPPSHPFFACYPQITGRRFRAYGDWAARIPDVAKFFRRIGPALSRNLAASAMAGWSSGLTISTIDQGIKIKFQDGNCVSVEPCAFRHPHDADVRLTPGRFESLVLGYRSFPEILAEDADCSASREETEAVVTCLFPPGDSFLRPL